jgi:hypothetical protein
VTSEEETLLWRALANIPDVYREPMVLFYREQRSIAEVSAGLDLSEDAVKQRLSRGRAMLREELATVVESTLKLSRPTKAFTAAVLAALPLLPMQNASGAAATGAIVAKGVATAAKTALSGTGLGVLLGPLTGILMTVFGSRAAATTAHSPRERQYIRRHSLGIASFCFAMSAGLAAALSQAGKLYQISSTGMVVGIFVWVVALVFTVHIWARHMQRVATRMRTQTSALPKQT